MAAEIGEPPRLIEHFLIAEIVEELDETPPGLAGGFQEAGAGLVGPRFLLTAVAQRAEGPGVLGVADQHRASVRRARQSSQNAKTHGQDHRLEACAHHLVGADGVAMRQGDPSRAQ